MTSIEQEPVPAGHTDFERNANPLIQRNLGDTIAATRDYVADMANAVALDDQQSRGSLLRLLVVLSALDHLAAEKLHHR